MLHSPHQLRTAGILGRSKALIEIAAELQRTTQAMIVESRALCAKTRSLRQERAAHLRALVERCDAGADSVAEGIQERAGCGRARPICARRHGNCAERSADP